MKVIKNISLLYLTLILTINEIQGVEFLKKRVRKLFKLVI